MNLGQTLSLFNASIQGADASLPMQGTLQHLKDSDPGMWAQAKRPIRAIESRYAVIRMNTPCRMIGHRSIGKQARVTSQAMAIRMETATKSASIFRQTVLSGRQVYLNHRAKSTV